MKKLLIAVLLCCAKVLAQTAATPTFSPTPGFYKGPTAVTVTSSTSGAKVFCTTDGSVPTILSPRVSGTVQVNSTTTLKCIAAVAGVDRQNADDNNPNVAGTYWKPADTANGGGHGHATSTVHTSGNPTPALDGASMEFGETSQTGAQTNVLWATHNTFGTCDGCTYFASDFYSYPSTNGSVATYEYDNYNFDSKDRIRFMYGMQHVPSHGWDIVGNSNVDWTASGVTDALTPGQWNHIQVLNHRVASEISSKPCTDKFGAHWPCLYFDKLIINGNEHDLNKKFAANADPYSNGYWTGPAFQFQIDIPSRTPGIFANEYVDKANFLATYDPSSSATGIYTIGSNGGTLQIAPTTSTLAVGATELFTANMAASWSASCGTITSGGIYTAPATSGTCTVTGTVNTQTATGTVTVTDSDPGGPPPGGPPPGGGTGPIQWVQSVTGSSVTTEPDCNHGAIPVTASVTVPNVALGDVLVVDVTGNTYYTGDHPATTITDTNTATWTTLNTVKLNQSVAAVAWSFAQQAGTTVVTASVEDNFSCSESVPLMVKVTEYANALGVGAWSIASDNGNANSLTASITTTKAASLIHEFASSLTPSPQTITEGNGWTQRSGDMTPFLSFIWDGQAPTVGPYSDTVTWQASFPAVYLVELTDNDGVTTPPPPSGNPTALAPTCSPSPGVYSSPVSVTLSDGSPSPTIYYTTDGSTPTTSSSVFSSAISITQSTTIKAIAASAGLDNSPVGVCGYTIGCGASAFGRGSVDYSQIKIANRLGSAPLFQMAGGTAITPGNLPMYDCNGNLVDSGTSPTSVTATASTLFGVTGSIGGSALGWGGVNTSTATVPGAKTTMTASASPVTDPGSAFTWSAFVSASDTVTVREVAVIPGTPTATAFNVAVQVPPPPTVLAVSPTTAALSTGASVTFTANLAATWSATCGTITSSGVYTAPSTAGTCTVAATGSGGQTATATVTVTAPAALTVSPASVTLAPSATQTFTASATSTWTASCGTITSGGVYTAPSTTGSCTVTATASGHTATAAVTVATTSAACTGTYCIDGTNGSDSNAGTAAAPWKTLAKLSSTCPSPGQSIQLARGMIYPGRSITLPCSGTSSNWITYGAYGTGANPIIDGGYPVTGFTLVSGSTYSAPLSFSPLGTNQEGGSWVQMLSDFVRLTQASSLSGMTAGSYWWSNGTAYVWLADSSNPNSHHIEAGGPGAPTPDTVNANGQSYINWDHIDITASTRNNFTADKDNAGHNSHDVTVSNMTSSIPTERGFSLSCYFSGCTHDNIKFSHDHAYGAHEEEAWLGFGTNNGVEDCEFEDTDVLIGNGAINNYVRRSYFHNSTIYIESENLPNAVPAKGTIVDSNRVVIDSGNPNQLLNDQGTNTRDTHNLYVNVSAISDFLYMDWQQGIAQRATGGIHANNTYIKKTTQWGQLWNPTTAVTNETLKNNLFYDSVPIHGTIISTFAGMTGTAEDYNLLPNGPYFCQATNTYPQTLAAWVTACNQDHHSISTTPTFVDFAGGNYRLASGSAGIDAGVVITGVTDGYSGTAPDMGAYEFGNAAIGPPSSGWGPQ